ncbi:hypothetical protein TKK_0015782 [Trichogramma kaykai]
MENPDTCFSAGSIAGAVIGTFAVTCLLFGLAALIYRQWRRHKGESTKSTMFTTPVSLQSIVGEKTRPKIVHEPVGGHPNARAQLESSRIAQTGSSIGGPYEQQQKDLISIECRHRYRYRVRLKFGSFSSRVERRPTIVQSAAPLYKFLR